MAAEPHAHICKQMAIFFVVHFITATCTFERSMKHPVYQNLERFIRKYYVHQLLRGCFLMASFGLGAALLFFYLTGINDFGMTARKLLFFMLLALEIGIFMRFIVLPVLGIYGLRRGLNEAKAAVIIGNHFPEVADQLQNFMELDANPDKSPLLAAAIAQKTDLLRVVPFETALSYEKAIKYAKFMIPVGTAMVLLWLFGQWTYLEEGSKKLVQYQKEFLPVAPFQITVVGIDEPHLAGGDLEVMIELSGKQIPSELFLMEGNNLLLPKSEDAQTFKHLFRKLDRQINFYVEAAGFRFGPYVIDVIYPPVLSQIKILVNPPAYTQLKDFEVQSFTDVIFPEGSKVVIEASAKAVDSLVLLRTRDSLRFAFDGRDFDLVQVYKESFSGQILGSNAQTSQVLSGQQFFQVVKDRYPNVNAQFYLDSVRMNGIQVTGMIEDDYGFKRLWLAIENNKGEQIFKKELPIVQQSLRQGLNGYVSFDEAQLSSKESYRARIYVSDNDGVNGSKTASSESFAFGILDKTERIAQQVGNTGKAAAAVQAQMEELEKADKQLEKSKSGVKERRNKRFESDKNIKELLKQQQDMLNKLEELKEERSEQRSVEEENQLFNERILEKQKKIDELLNQLADDEMKKLMEEIQKLMQELNNDALKEKLDQLQMENKHLMNQMDRYLQMLEQLQFEKSLEQQIQNLEELIQKQDELMQKGEMNQEAQNEQKALAKAVEDAKQALKKLEEQDEKLKDPNGFDGPDEELEDAQQDMGDAIEQMEQNEKKGTKGKQQSAKDQLNKAQKSLMDFQSQMASQQNAENMKDLRQILQNLLAFSFDQEQLMNQMRAAGSNTPNYPGYMRSQRLLQSNSQIIADSLNALSKRVPEISSFVGRELLQIDRNLSKSLEHFAERDLGRGNSSQQFVMTSTNNLANLLQEALEEMQQQQAAMMDGSQNCQKPGKGKGSMESLKKMQQDLAKELGKMKGNQPGMPQPGSKQGMGQMSKELVEMMAKQEQIRKALEGMESKQEGEGKDGNNGLKQAIEEMKKNEEDLANKRFDAAFYERQQEILTRLLEVEDADLQRKEDEQRKGETATSQRNNSGRELDLYLKEKSAQIEQLRYEQLRFRGFYSAKILQFSR